MKILLTTGVYPPDIGGPAQYARNLRDAFERMGHDVRVLSFGFEKKLPTGVRHAWFFVRALVHAIHSDTIVTLDTFSVGFPSVLVARLLGKKVLVRVGGDFLWEQYALHDEILLEDFYTQHKSFTLKEKMQYHASNYVFTRGDIIAFTTEWQKRFTQKEYMIPSERCRVVENFYGPKQQALKPEKKTFRFVGRDIPLKNAKRFRRAFAQAQKECPDMYLDDEVLSHDEHIDRIKESYAVVVPSISEVAPNTIIEAITYSKPFIATRHTGLFDTLEGVGRFVDPFDIGDMAHALCELATDEIYTEYQNKVRSFTKVHDWDTIASQYINLLK